MSITEDMSPRVRVALRARIREALAYLDNERADAIAPNEHWGWCSLCPHCVTGLEILEALEDELELDADEATVQLVSGAWEVEWDNEADAAYDDLETNDG